MFEDRYEAGKLLAEKLKEYQDRSDTLILAIPRGGVVVGSKIANILHLPLRVIVVRKLGAPDNPELAIGAIASDRVKIIDEKLALLVGASKQYLQEEIAKKTWEIAEKEKKLGIKKLNSWEVKGKTLIVTDDGVATGATTLAAIKYLRKLASENQEQVKIILAVPVIAKDTYDKLKSEVNKVVFLEMPESFGAVGEFYQEFPQVTDEEVKNILSNLSNLSHL